VPHCSAVRIARGQVISGHDALALRGALRRLRGRPFSPEEAAWRLAAPEDQAPDLVVALADAGLVEEAAPGAPRPWYKLTLAGNALANATARKPVSRAVARRHLEGLIARAEIIDASPDYLVWVERILVFGSYLDEGVERLSDVDVALELVPRTGGDEFIELGRGHVEQAMR